MKFLKLILACCFAMLLINISEAQPLVGDPLMPQPIPKPIGTSLEDFEKFRTLGVGPGRLRVLNTRLPTTVPSISLASDRSFLSGMIGADWLRQGSFFGVTLYGAGGAVGSVEAAFFKRFGVSLGGILSESGSGLPDGLDVYGNVGLGLYGTYGSGVFRSNSLIKNVQDLALEFAVRPSIGVRYHFSKVGVFGEFGASESGIYRVGLSFGKSSSKSRMTSKYGRR